MVHRRSKDTEESEQLAEDLMVVVTVFVSSHHGKRAAEGRRRRRQQREKKKEEVEKIQSKENVQPPSKENKNKKRVLYPLKNESETLKKNGSGSVERPIMSRWTFTKK